MKRLIVGSAGLYLFAAAVGHARERAGAAQCGCASECGCKKPLLSVFRWVAPFRHKGLGSEQKQALAESMA